MSSRSSNVHPRAIVHEEAQLHESVVVEENAIIGQNVSLGEGSIVYSGAILQGNIKCGKNNRFHHYCVVGADPQDLTYKNEETEVIIGDNNIFREFVSIHKGTAKDKGVTKIGSNNFLMAYVHLAHDVHMGSSCIVANSTNFAGHVEIADEITIGGGCHIVQFAKIGKAAYLGAGSVVDRDIPNFCTAYGNRAKLKGINIIGLKRRKYDPRLISSSVNFYRTMESSHLSPQSFINNKELMEDFLDNEIINELVGFIQKSDLGIAPFLI